MDTRKIEKTLIRLIKEDHYKSFILFYDQYGHSVIDSHFSTLVNASSFSTNTLFLQKLQERPEYKINITKHTDYILSNSISQNNFPLTKFVFEQLDINEKNNTFIKTLHFDKYKIAKYMLSQFKPINTKINHATIYIELMSSNITSKLKFKILNSLEEDSFNIDSCYINGDFTIEKDNLLNRLLKNNDIDSLKNVIIRKIIIQPKFYELFKEIGKSNNYIFFNELLKGIPNIHYDNNRILKEIVSSENPIILNRLFDEFIAKDFSIIANHQYLKDEIMMAKRYIPLLSILEHACDKEVLKMDNNIQKKETRIKNNKI